MSPLILVAIALHLYSPADVSSLTRKILHSMHGPGFAGLTFAVFAILRRRRRSPRNYIAAAVILAATILIAEVLQGFVARSTQLSDMAVDALAVFGVLGVFAATDRQIAVPIILKASLAPMAAIALVTACAPTGWLGFVYAQQKSAFPELLINEHRWEREQMSPVAGHLPVRSRNPDVWPGSGASVLEAIPEGQYGIFLSLHPAPDWRGYEQLSFVSASVTGAYDLMVCIRERRRSVALASRRMCRVVPVNTTPATYSIRLARQSDVPSEESIDFSRIEAIVFSQARPGGDVKLRLDDIRLVNLATEAP